MGVEVLLDRCKGDVVRWSGLNTVHVVEHESVVTPGEVSDEHGEVAIREFGVEEREHGRVLLLGDSIGKDASQPLGAVVKVGWEGVFAEVRHQRSIPSRNSAAQTLAEVVLPALGDERGARLTELRALATNLREVLGLLDWADVLLHVYLDEPLQN